jgi:PAS domain S-box-containing protein
LILAPDSTSVRAARRYVTRALVEAGHPEWVDDAALAVSEIVTNVVLHARTPCELYVDVHSDGVRVAVRDFSLALPGQRNFGPDATTGRGLVLVSRLATDHGVQALGQDGKVVWFVVDGTGGERYHGEVASYWELDGLPAGEGRDTRGFVALLVGVPTTMWMAGLEHWSAVLRELYLVLASPPADALGSGTAGAVLGGADLGGADLATAGVALRCLTEGTERALQAAAQDPTLARLAPLPPGHPSVMPDVPAVLNVQVADIGTGAGFAMLASALDVGQRLAAGSHLLVRPALAELVAVGDWACQQVLAQTRGEQPAPCEVSERDVALLERVPAPQWSDVGVSTSARAVVAADDHNRLLAVSESAARLVGFSAGELVGRPVTTIIPHRLRQQHVAGFTRHLATGQARALGVELDLPVLCADGSEVVRRFLIQADVDPTGRRVYVAWMDPLPTGTEHG